MSTFVSCGLKTTKRFAASYYYFNVNACVFVNILLTTTS